MRLNVRSEATDALPGGAARVLAALRRAEGGVCSGERLSHELGVSRAQVWKHVEALRARGYRIAGEPGGGYRLCGVPDRLYPEELLPRLDTRWLGRRLVWLESTDSTNRVALDLARAGAEHGTAVIAEGQTAGRGRLGRAFFSPPFANLYTSLVLRPLLSTAEAPTLVLAAAVAVAEAVGHEVGGLEAIEVKWPNDVLLGGLKVSGILMELGAEAARVAHVVLGIGVNLNLERSGFPRELRRIATSLRAYLGRPVDRVGFTAGLYGTLEEVLDRHAERGFEALRSRYERLFRMGGERVRVSEPGGRQLEGVALGIGEQGALEIRTPAGERIRVLAGDVTRVRPGSKA